MKDLTRDLNNDFYNDLGNFNEIIDKIRDYKKHSASIIVMVSIFETLQELSDRVFNEMRSNTVEFTSTIDNIECAFLKGKIEAFREVFYTLLQDNMKNYLAEKIVNHLLK